MHIEKPEVCKSLCKLRAKNEQCKVFTLHLILYWNCSREVVFPSLLRLHAVSLALVWWENGGTQASIYIICAHTHLVEYNLLVVTLTLPILCYVKYCLVVLWLGSYIFRQVTSLWSISFLRECFHQLDAASLSHLFFSFPLHLYIAPTCARSFSENNGEVRLCTTLASIFIGSEVAVSSVDTSATGE